MSSNDNKENDCKMLKLMMLRKYSCSECDKVFQNCSPFSRHRNLHKKLNINTMTIPH